MIDHEFANGGNAKGVKAQGISHEVFLIFRGVSGPGVAGNGFSSKNHYQKWGRDPNPCPGDPFRGHFPFSRNLRRRLQLELENYYLEHAPLGNSGCVFESFQGSVTGHGGNGARPEFSGRRPGGGRAAAGRRPEISGRWPEKSGKIRLNPEKSGKFRLNPEKSGKIRKRPEKIRKNPEGGRKNPEGNEKSSKNEKFTHLCQHHKNLRNSGKIRKKSGKIRKSPCPV